VVKRGNLRFDEETYADMMSKHARFVSAAHIDLGCSKQTLLELRTLSFDLPMPPSVNEAWHALLNGGKALTAEHRRFRSLVVQKVHQQMREAPPLAGRVELTLILCFADRRRTDIDNRVKPLQDALKHARAYHDDSQVDRLVVERWLPIDLAAEFCKVMLRELAL
jgi:Holliday junction resolvase RusA-like endonuclease